MRVYYNRDFSGIWECIIIGNFQRYEVYYNSEFSGIWECIILMNFQGYGSVLY